MDMLINAALTEAFLDKVRKLNRRAVKLGASPVEFEFGAYEEIACRRGALGCFQNTEGKWVALYVNVEIKGDAPCLEGWEFLATVDLTGSKPVVRRQPWTGEGVDLSCYFHSTGYCQHCNTQRARNSTLILRNTDTGALIEIGRNCAADFFRGKDASALLNVWEKMSDDLSGGEYEKYAAPIFSLSAVFSTAAACVRKWGYAKAQDGQRDDTVTPTRSRVRFNLMPPINAKREELVEVLPEDWAEAAEIIAWLEAEWLNITAKTEFQQTIQAVVEDDGGYKYVRAKNINYLVWMVEGYRADKIKKEEKARAAAAAKSSAAVGVVGERSDFHATLINRRLFASEYGQKALCRFRDDVGNTLIWWGTGAAAFDMLLDEVYSFKATVKGHSTYEGNIQTELSRVTVTSGKMKERE
jgi:hypothetical protein